MAIKTIPSLVVGIGGTGKRALTHLKRRIYDTYGTDELPWVRLLAIDTDSAGVNNPPVISQTTGEHLNLGTAEMRLIDQSDTPQVISNLQAPENQHILDWYPDPEMRVDFPKAARGSGQVRMFGRIGLYKGDNLHTTYRWLQQASHDVSDPAAWEMFPGFDVDHKLQFVYVICSICGGTGSGMFLDVAYLLRKLVGVDPSTRRFIGMFVLPEVYEPVVENQHIKRIYANSYAALRELDYLMNSPKRSFRVRGKDHTFAEFKKDVPPFDFVFLFSNKNKRGAVISQRQVSGEKPVAIDDRVAQYMAETVMTDVLSPLTERSESILSNIFTSLAEPETSGDRTFYKAYSAVGISSVKVPPIDQFLDLIEARLTNAVVDFLLRPDPDVTEKTLAKEFFAEHISRIEDQLALKESLSSDPAYSRYMSRSFTEEFKINRQACIHKLSQWAELIMSDTVDGEHHLECEAASCAHAGQTVKAMTDALEEALRKYCKDPKYGYAFLREWLEELAKLASSKRAQLPPSPVIEGDPARPVKEALESLKKVNRDIQLPLMKDTKSILLERLVTFYDGRARALRSRALIQQFYNSLIGVFESLRDRVRAIEEILSAVDKDSENLLNSRIAVMSDTQQERVLIDKSLIGRREVESFTNGLLASLWVNGDWKAAVPEFSEEIKRQIDSDLSSRLFEIQMDAARDRDERRHAITEEIKEFLRQRLLDPLFPVDPLTGRRKEPSFTAPDGRSLLLSFASENLLSLMVAHSTPLWFIQTHQVSSASQPITFVGLNGTKVPERLVEELQKQIPTFRPTDIVLSDGEARIVVKQYDPLYSLASLVSMPDYENYYRNTDRKFNPMHTDIKFVKEPNPYLQWLSYESPSDELPQHEPVSGEGLARELSKKLTESKTAAHPAGERAPAGNTVEDALAKSSAPEIEAKAPVATSEAKDTRQSKGDEAPLPVRTLVAAVNPAPPAPVVQAKSASKVFNPSQVLRNVKVYLCDQNPDVVEALKHFFGRRAGVEVVESNILDLPVSCLVVPSNSFGIMDTGLACALNKLSDSKLEARVRQLIEEHHSGELPVGCAEVIITEMQNPSLAVIAPTLRVPARMTTTASVNSYLATRAALLALARYMQDESDNRAKIKVESVALTGMGTGIGRCPVAVAAFQMYEAFCQIFLGEEPNFATLEAAAAHDQELKSNRFVS